MLAESSTSAVTARHQTNREPTDQSRHIPLWGKKAGFAHKLTLTRLKQDMSQDHVVPDNGCLSTGHLLNPGFCCLVCFLFTRGTNTVSITATYYTITV